VGAVCSFLLFPLPLPTAAQLSCSLFCVAVPVGVAPATYSSSAHCPGFSWRTLGCSSLRTSWPAFPGGAGYPVAPAAPASGQSSVPHFHTRSRFFFSLPAAAPRFPSVAMAPPLAAPAASLGASHIHTPLPLSHFG